ncbi:hypothetical protein SAMD00023353_1002530 [Rosellinia necatrix]|uniref:Uncharacterized protein n=1 Tax=Rosellinia necatrix TaxID=77044 RepID=A0A1W2TBJ1_ROSNE|nr:hypothetical protein SAMD00023353_1002530 [Rosellinia necatrix]
MPETLREKAAGKLHGPGANPSLLGDPVSLKAESSDTVPTDEELGAATSPPPPPPPPPPASSAGRRGSGDDGSGRGGETLREKAVKKLGGPDANPSQLGDPISLKNETSPSVPTESERGAEGEEVVRRDSKL